MLPVLHATDLMIDWEVLFGAIDDSMGFQLHCLVGNRNFSSKGVSGEGEGGEELNRHAFFPTVQTAREFFWLGGFLDGTAQQQQRRHPNNMQYVHTCYAGLPRREKSLFGCGTFRHTRRVRVETTSPQPNTILVRAAPILKNSVRGWCATSHTQEPPPCQLVVQFSTCQFRQQGVVQLDCRQQGVAQFSTCQG